MLFFSAANLLVSLLAPEHYQVVLYGMERTLYSTVAGRIIIGLRAAARAPQTSTDLSYLMDRSGTDRL